jgi:hypothetical protein
MDQKDTEIEPICIGSSGMERLQRYSRKRLSLDSVCFRKAQVFQLLALIGAPAHCRMEAEAVRVGAQTWRGWLVWARQALQAQHFLPRPRPERDAVGLRGCLQGLERVIPIRSVEVVHALLFDEKPLAGQQPHDARDDLSK